MKPKIIRLCYRKIIDSTATQAWDKLVFEDSYAEFLLQAQLYNQEKKYTTFSDMVHHVPAARQLHFLVSAAVIGYLKQLNDRVPDLKNNLGLLFLPFLNYQFELINSDVTNKLKHQVAINFFTDELVWHDTVNDMLLLSIARKEVTAGVISTELFRIQPFVSIYSLNEVS